MAVRHDRDAGDMSYVATDLRNLAECLGQLGLPGLARDAAAESLTSAQAAGDRQHVCFSHVRLGWAAGLVGDTTEAEHHFTAADQIQFADDPDGGHLLALPGALCAEWLVHTGRHGPALALTERNAEICRENGWNENLGSMRPGTGPARPLRPVTPPGPARHPAGSGRILPGWRLPRRARCHPGRPGQLRQRHGGPGRRRPTRN